MSVGRGEVQLAAMSEVVVTLFDNPVGMGPEPLGIDWLASGAVKEVNVDGWVLDGADAVPVNASLPASAIPAPILVVAHAEAALIADVADDPFAGGAGGAEEDLVPAGLVGLSVLKFGKGVLFQPYLVFHGGAWDDGVVAEPPEEAFADVKADWRQEVVVVVSVEEVAQLHLLEVVGATDGACLLAGLGERREKHGCENCDDRNHDKQLNEGE